MKARVSGRVERRQRGGVIGDQDPRFISTCYIERPNLTMRMSMRGFHRLTNGSSTCLRPAPSA
jgi:hypothetical protein